MKKHILIVIFFIGFTATAQQELDAYKYVVVPSKFDFQKKANQYGVNMLLKYKFQQLGFETYLDTDVLPEALKGEGCSSLRPTIISKGGMFTTRLLVEVTDCLNRVLFRTVEGSSKEKSYKVSYNIALREAFTSFGDYRLSYTPKVKVEEKEEKEIIVIQAPKLEVVTNNEVFFYNKNTYNFIKSASVFHAEISDSKTNAVIGKISKSSRSGIYHVILSDVIGIGYYDETGNFIVEVIETNGNVLLHKFQLVD